MKKTGVEIIAEERKRKRQIEVEEWTAEEDAEYTNNELAKAAACYAALSTAKLGFSSNEYTNMFFKLWPWGFEWWKPTPEDRVRELAKAGALIAAEIDRLNNIK